MSDTCVVCLRPAAREYHPRCMRRLTGQPKLPDIAVDPSRLHAFGLDMTGKVTVSGVQRKVALGIVDGVLRVAAAGAGYLLKPQVAEYPALPENEHLTLGLARLLGIRVPETGLVRLRDESRALLIRRFDRTESGRKLAMEDLCQLAEKLPAEKYDGSAELCVRVIRQYSAAAPLDVLALFRQLLFCWWIGNGDLHLKNLSLLDSGNREPRLSPAYELVNTNLAIPDDPFAMPLDGKRRNLGVASWIRFAEYCALPSKVVRRVASSFLEREAAALAMIEASYLDAELRERYHAIMATRRRPIADLAEAN